MLEIKHLHQYHTKLDPNFSVLPTVIKDPFFYLIFPSRSDKHSHKTQSVIVIHT